MFICNNLLIESCTCGHSSVTYLPLCPVRSKVRLFHSPSWLAIAAVHPRKYAHALIYFVMVSDFTHIMASKLTGVASVRQYFDPHDILTLSIIDKKVFFFLLFCPLDRVHCFINNIINKFLSSCNTFILTPLRPVQIGFWPPSNIDDKVLFTFLNCLIGYIIILASYKYFLGIDNVFILHYQHLELGLKISYDILTPPWQTHTLQILLRYIDTWVKILWNVLTPGSVYKEVIRSSHTSCIIRWFRCKRMGFGDSTYLLWWKWYKQLILPIDH